MDPLSATAGVLQIVGQCAQCTVALAKWMWQVKTVDTRLKQFYDQVLILQTNHENLQENLQSPQIIDAARRTNDSSGRLWSQISASLEDCRQTLIAINQTLDKINKPSMFGKPLKQLLESIHSGDLARYYERVRMFNVNIQIPMQLISITLQISQGNQSQINHNKLEDQIISTKGIIMDMDRRIKNIKPFHTTSRRSSASLGSTAVDVSQVDGAVYENIEKCMDRARNFLSSASVVSARSNAGSVLRASDNRQPQTSVWQGSEQGVMLSQLQQFHIDSWVRDPQTTPQELPERISPRNDQDPGHTFEHPPLEEEVSNTVNEVQLELAGIYVKNGQFDKDSEKYADAEENFREALTLLEENDFGQSLAFDPADVKIWLAECCFKQDKYEEAVELLQHVAEPAQSVRALNARPNDPWRKLEADHMLGQVYLKKEDFAHAENYALRAFQGRRDALREHQTNAIETAYKESVQLCVDVYQAMGNRAKARAYATWLTKPRTVSQSENGTGHRSSIARNTVLPIEEMRPPSTPVITAPSSPPATSTDLFHVQTNTTRSTSNTFPPIMSDDASTSTSITKTDVTRMSVRFSESRSVSRTVLDPGFKAVKELAAESKDRAVAAALKILEQYDPNSRILVIRTPELKQNIRKRGKDLGLAATGYGYAPIHFFCELTEYEAIPEVEFLIDHGVNLSAVRYKASMNSEARTPLQLAIERGHEKLATIIVEASHEEKCRRREAADINAVYDKDCLPPLLAACRMGQVIVVEKLLDYGARVMGDFPGMWYGNSLLHDSCSRCDTEMVRMLLGYKDQTVPVTRYVSCIGTMGQQDKFGATPLMYAITSINIMSSQLRDKLRRRTECVGLLLEQSMRSGTLEHDLTIRNAKGMDVFGFAEQEKDVALLNLLNQYARASRSSAPPKELE